MAQRVVGGEQVARLRLADWAEACRTGILEVPPQDLLGRLVPLEGLKSAYALRPRQLLRLRPFEDALSRAQVPGVDERLDFLDIARVEVVGCGEPGVEQSALGLDVARELPLHRGEPRLGGRPARHAELFQRLLEVCFDRQPGAVRPVG